jgi:GNAT superfamily N-acetyltransferase
VSVRVTRASLRDAAVVHRIMLEAFAEYSGLLQPPSGAHDETVADVREAMRRGGAVLAWDQDRPVASARFSLAPDHLYVGRVAVLLSHRRRGIASAVMAWMEREALARGHSVVRVGVRMSLPSNVALYQHLGYRLIDVQPHPKGPDHVGTLLKTVGGS